MELGYLSLTKVDVSEFKRIVLAVYGDDDLSLLLSGRDDDDLRFLKGGRQCRSCDGRRYRATFAYDGVQCSVGDIKVWSIWK